MIVQATPRDEEFRQLQMTNATLNQTVTIQQSEIEGLRQQIASLVATLSNVATCFHNSQIEQRLQSAPNSFIPGPNLIAQLNALQGSEANAPDPNFGATTLPAVLVNESDAESEEVFDGSWDNQPDTSDLASHLPGLDSIYALSDGNLDGYFGDFDPGQFD